MRFNRGGAVLVGIYLLGRAERAGRGAMKADHLAKLKDRCGPAPSPHGSSGHVREFMGSPDSPRNAEQRSEVGPAGDTQMSIL